MFVRQSCCSMPIVFFSIRKDRAAAAFCFAFVAYSILNCKFASFYSNIQAFVLNFEKRTFFCLSFNMKEVVWNAFCCIICE